MSSVPNREHQEVRTRAPVALALLGLALLAVTWPACGTPDLEIRGAVARTVGEKLVLDLVQGDPAFSGEAQLLDANRRTFDSTQLRATRPTERTLEVRIPTGVVIGPGLLEIGQEGSDERYVVDLELSRLALVTTESTLQTLPLPGSTTAATQQSLTGGGALALSPDGGHLVVVEGSTGVNVYDVGAQLSRSSTTPYQATSPVVAVAATNDGALVATDRTLVLLAFGAAMMEEASFAIAGIRDVAVDQSGKRAVAISACDTDSDTIADGDCLTLIELAGGASTISREVKLDDVPSATQIAIRADGSAAVVPDTDVAYGLVLDDPAAKPSELPWPETMSPVDIDRAPSELGDIFAVADAAGSQVQIVGFDGAVLKPVGQPVPLDPAPTRLAFGRQADLYVTTGTGLSRINPYDKEPAAAPLALGATAPILSLVIQR